MTQALNKATNTIYMLLWMFEQKGHRMGGRFWGGVIMWCVCGVAS